MYKLGDMVWVSECWAGMLVGRRDSLWLVELGDGRTVWATGEALRGIGA